MMNFRRSTAMTFLVLGLLLGATACDSNDDRLETAKSTVCNSAPDWQATLERVANADDADGSLQTEVDELATGVDDAATALADAGADAIAEAATSLSQTVNEIATALDEGAPGAAERAAEASTRLDALTSLAECD
jgi:hypothetical protein